MKWSYRLGEIAGIGVYVHATFFLLLAFFGIASYADSRSPATAAGSVLFIIALFACVVAHEYGHALTARRFGIKTRDITLLPIGGVARLEKMPEDPAQELWVSLAGPAVSLAIALGLFAYLTLSGALVPVTELGLTGTNAFVERLMVVNLFLVLFNMLPAFPMDGGRILRAILASRMDYVRATGIAASIGQTMAIAFGFIGLFTNPFLLLIAFFVWIGAAQEASQVQTRSAMGGISVQKAMVTQFRTLDQSATLDDAIQMILSGSQQDFPVVYGDSIVGILTRQKLLSALAQMNRETPVSAVMHREFQQVDPSETLEGAFQKLQSCQCHTLPVVQGGQIVGLLTMENVGEFIMIQSALSAARQAS